METRALKCNSFVNLARKAVSTSVGHMESCSYVVALLRLTTPRLLPYNAKPNHAIHCLRCAGTSMQGGKGISCFQKARGIWTSGGEEKGSQRENAPSTYGDRRPWSADILASTWCRSNCHVTEVTNCTGGAERRTLLISWFVSLSSFIPSFGFTITSSFSPVVHMTHFATTANGHYYAASRQPAFDETYSSGNLPTYIAIWKSGYRPLKHTRWWQSVLSFTCFELFIGRHCFVLHKTRVWVLQTCKYLVHPFDGYSLR